MEIIQDGNDITGTGAGYIGNVLLPGSDMAVQLKLVMPIWLVK